MKNDFDSGSTMHGWARDMWSFPRSITGDGTRATLRYLQDLFPEWRIFEVPSGTKALDWKVPQEWRIHRAYIEDLNGNRLIDLNESNLHVVSYSTPINAILSRDQLEPHLHSIEALPRAIPYVTSYYRNDWGFCLTHEQRGVLGDGPFRVFIDAEKFDGSLTYAEAYLPGTSTDEVLLWSYVCHPDMANNELSGPIVLTALARWLAQQTDRHYSYRLALGPETIGSIVYISRSLEHMQKHVKAAWVLSCIGDDRNYSYLESRSADTVTDRVTIDAYEALNISYKRYTWNERGSDERQFGAPNVDLPVCSIMRTKYGQYPEYHTSLDDLSVVTPAGLAGGLRAAIECVKTMERKRLWQSTVMGEPFFGKTNLPYPTIGTGVAPSITKALKDILAQCDGRTEVEEIARKTQRSLNAVREVLAVLEEADLVTLRLR